MIASHAKYCLNDYLYDNRLGSPGKGVCSFFQKPSNAVTAPLRLNPLRVLPAISVYGMHHTHLQKARCGQITIHSHFILSLFMISLDILLVSLYYS
jgi:hypothetical protein